MMAMFDCKYKTLSSLNAFNDLDKDRYLSYTNNYYKSYKLKMINNNMDMFKPIVVAKMPLYSKNLGQYFLECADTTCSFDIYAYLHNK